MQEVPRRGEIPERYRWELESLYPTDAQWEADLTRVTGLLPNLRALQGRAADAPDQFLAALRLRDEVQRLAERLFVYAHLRRSEDSTNHTYQALADRATALQVQVASAAAFLVPEIVALPAATLEAYLRQQPELEVYRHYLDNLMRQQPHTRSPEVEELLAAAGEVTAAPYQIFSMFNEADIAFPTIADEDGQPVQLSHGRYVRFMEHPDRRVRRDAFMGVHGVYRQRQNTLAAMLGAQVRANIFMARARRYPSALAAALGRNHIPIAVYDQLVDTVGRNLGHLHRLNALQRRILNLPDLAVYDLRAPLAGDVDRDIPYDEAAVLVVSALGALGAGYQEQVVEGLRSRWADVYESVGKTPGGFCWGAYGSHPVILMNYQNRLNDVFTLIHEVGHAMHFHYTWSTQPFVYSQYTHFVAEVASTVNEALLVHYLLERETNRNMRRYLLSHQIRDIRSLIYGCTMLAEFERDIHARAEAGEALTAEGLNQAFHGLQARYQGPGVAIPPEAGVGWARIPHFYDSFYNYQYATGLAAALALTEQILTEGEPARERYRAFLRAGASDYSIALLQQAGVDMTTPAPVQRVLDLFGRLVDELDRLTAGD